jgi:S1-C subfamily serine protease
MEKSKDSKTKKQSGKRSLCKFIKIKDPKKAGIVAFVTMLVITSVLLGVSVTYLIINNGEFFVEDGVVEDEDDKLEVVVTEQENAVIEAVQNAKDSVVSIAVSRLSFSTQEGLVDQSNNIGTGFVVDSNGIIVTNQHVVSDLDSEYRVVTSDGTEYSVVEIERDDNNDIAVLKIDATELKALKLGDSDAIVVGQSVIAIGTPLGEYMGSVTTGIISGLDRDVATSSGWFSSSSKSYENVIQTDAAINPGNSGGPLLNTSGEVIGVSFATTAGADNISFALPINIVKSRVEEYRTYGKFIKPYLGVSYQMISDYQALYYDNVVAGALVVRTDPYGPAQAAGIERGDIITKFADEDVTQSLSALISSHEVGEEVEITIWNQGEERNTTVVLGELD